MPQVSIDSRLVKPGDTFFALPGNRVDGHTFLKQVAEKGATAAVVSTQYEGPSFGMELQKVDDVKLELQERAKRCLEEHPKRVVAISGTLGKTTTKFFAKTLLEKKFRVFASPKSYNSQLTVPLSILICPEDAEILILEMGMTEPGNLKRLIEIAPPEVAVLTQVSMQHADGFEDGLEGILKEKLTLFSHPKTRLCIHHESIPWKGQSFSVEPQFGLEGPILHNFCAAKAIAEAFGVEVTDANGLQLPPMRMEEVERGEIHFINDAYNANSDSMLAALSALAKRKGRRLAVLSEMDALGSFSAQEHEKVGKKALECADLLLCLGKHCDTMRLLFERAGKPVFYCSSKDELAKRLKAIAKPGDHVLIKGARAYALDELLDQF